MQAKEDKYTRPLMQSHERADFTSKLAAALSGKSPEERIAVGQDFAETHARRGNRHAFVSALAEVDARREAVAVGEGCGQPMSCSIGPNTQPHCYVDGRRLCDYDRVGVRTVSTAGDAVFTLSPQPAAGSAYWRPKATRMWAIRASDPSIPAWEGLFITSITVGTAPVEGFNNAAAAGQLQGVAFADYVVPDWDAVPVGWPVFSNDANAQQLIISGIGLWPTASNYIAGVSVLGNRFNPANATESRCHDGSTRIPDMPAAGSYTAGGSYPL